MERAQEELSQLEQQHANHDAEVQVRKELLWMPCLSVLRMGIGTYTRTHMAFFIEGRR